MTIERPLRLRYEMTLERKSAFLDACPHLLEDVQRIDKNLGREPLMNWNQVLKKIKKINTLKWSAKELALFRSVCTDKDPEAEQVLKVKDSYEADADLRDYENIPLKIDINEYFQNEVLPFAPDAWIDNSKDKIGYEINFNRYFFKNKANRALSEINEELNEIEQEILNLLSN